MKKKSDSLVKEIQEFIWSENPVEATMVGVHRYDDRLEKLDVVSRRNKLKRKQEYLEQIKRIEKSGGLGDELTMINLSPAGCLWGLSTDCQKQRAVPLPGASGYRPDAGNPAFAFRGKAEPDLRG